MAIKRRQHGGAQHADQAPADADIGAGGRGNLRDLLHDAEHVVDGKDQVAAAMSVVRTASWISSDVISKQAKMTRRTPPMKVTQPLTVIDVRDPRVDAVDGDVEVGDPEAPADVDPLADGAVHQGDAADQEYEHPEVEGEAGRLGPGGRQADVGIGRQAGAGRGRRSYRRAPLREHPPPRAIPCPQSTASWRSSSGRPNRSGRSDSSDWGTTLVPSGVAPDPANVTSGSGGTGCVLPLSSSAILTTSDGP